MDLSEFVTLSDTTLTTDSRRVAKHFKKRHKNVLRALDALQIPPDFYQLNFEPVIETYTNGKGGLQDGRVIRMTKDGFLLLAMGFTGPEAVAIKIAYIGAFNAMAEQLHQIGNSLWPQRLDLEKREATSFMWASFGSKRMLERRREKPLLDNERAIMERVMQPGLFVGQAEPAEVMKSEAGQ